MAATTTVPTYGDLSDYGPGKFQKNADQLAYDAAQDCEIDFVGTTEYNGYLSLVSVDFATVRAEFGYNLTDADVRFLADQQAAIVEFHPSGAVYVEWFIDADAARARFEHLRPDFELSADWID
jgi:hypothetical protein